MSKESIFFVGELKDTIEHVAVVTTSLKQKTDQQRTTDDTSKLFSDNLTVVDELVAQIDNTAIESHQLNDAIAQEIKGVSSDLDALMTVSHMIERCESKLDEVVEAASPFAEPNLGENQKLMEKLYDQYTMEEERKIHRNVGSETDVSFSEHSSSNQEAVEEQPQEEDDGLGDFELF